MALLITKLTGILVSPGQQARISDAPWSEYRSREFGFGAGVAGAVSCSMMLKLSVGCDAAAADVLVVCVDLPRVVYPPNRSFIFHHRVADLLFADQPTLQASVNDVIWRPTRSPLSRPRCQDLGLGLQLCNGLDNNTRFLVKLSQPNGIKVIYLRPVVTDVIWSVCLYV